MVSFLNSSNLKITWEINPLFVLSWKEFFFFLKKYEFLEMDIELSVWVKSVHEILK